MKKVVYVTGCLGFIGSYVTRACLKEGWFVRGIDKQTYAAQVDLIKEFSAYSNFVYEKKDINDSLF
jgi:nucleoside-diphosphate-sugar epimerase